MISKEEAKIYIERMNCCTEDEYQDACISLVLERDEARGVARSLHGIAWFLLSTISRETGAPLLHANREMKKLTDDNNWILNED